MIVSPCSPQCMVAWNAAAFQFWAAYLAQRPTTALPCGGWHGVLPPTTGSTGPPTPAAANRNPSTWSPTLPRLLWGSSTKTDWRFS